MEVVEKSLLGNVIPLGKNLFRKLGDNASIVDLPVRLWVAHDFFAAGLTKISNWDLTVSLFESEYQVPLLPPEIAAYMGAATELSIPVLLTLGLGTRFAAFFLFIFNIIAVISYPGISEIGIRDHQIWGLLMLVTIFHGPGKLSVDHLLKKFYFNRWGQ